MLDEVRAIENVYYDAFESDEQVIREKILKIDALLKTKQSKYGEMEANLNFIRTAHK